MRTFSCSAATTPFSASNALIASLHVVAFAMATVAKRGDGGVLCAVPLSGARDDARTATTTTTTNANANGDARSLASNAARRRRRGERGGRGGRAVGVRPARRDVVMRPRRSSPPVCAGQDDDDQRDVYVNSTKVRKYVCTVGCPTLTRGLA